ncbi:MAG: Flp pilus assembly protein CpaB [Planctomycetes bacterium]|nr:Flp pilus assembly protein CpaB [Planctomycetota bacterium]
MKLTPARLTLGLFAVVGGLVTAYVYKELNRVEPPPQPEPRLVPMAVTDLEPGTLVTEAHLGLGPILREHQTPDTLTSDRAIAGRIVRARIAAATPIRTSQLYPPGEYPPLAVADGMRAVSVAVEGGGPLARVRPGDVVDIHMTPTSDGNDERTRRGVTFTLFQGVKVLSVGGPRTDGGPAATAAALTLELTPRQANTAYLARNHGSLNVSYNPGGTQFVTQDDERATLDELLGPMPEEPQPFVAEHFAGSARTTIQFENGRRTATEIDASTIPSRATVPNSSNQQPQTEPVTTQPPGDDRTPAGRSPL